jgi:hypothetical protein
VRDDNDAPIHVTLIDVRILVLGIAAGMWCGKEFVWCRRILATRTMLLAVSMSHRWGMSCLAPKLDAPDGRGGRYFLRHPATLCHLSRKCSFVVDTPAGSRVGFSKPHSVLAKRITNSEMFVKTYD